MLDLPRSAYHVLPLHHFDKRPTTFSETLWKLIKSLQLMLFTTVARHGAKATFPRERRVPVAEAVLIITGDKA